MSDILSLISIIFLPSIFTIILLFGIKCKHPIYDFFIDGAKDGLRTCFDILPYLIGIFIAIESLNSSGAMTYIEDFVRPVFKSLGISEELISLILLRPVSGSGSLMVAQDIMESAGPDSLVGRAAAVMVGSCETIFYVLALYFGVTSVKKMRHAFPAGLVGYIVGVLASFYICKII